MNYNLNNQGLSLEIKPLKMSDINTIVSVFKDLGWNKSSALFEKYLQEQNDRQRNIWVAWHGKEFVGYVTLKWHSDYMPFKAKGIPEINDLNVLPKYRTKGVGSKLLALAENEASIKSNFVGLGVGLYSDYGNAQKLYVKRGYIPDGCGITYRDQPCAWGDTVNIDDDLVLWFIKAFKNEKFKEN